MPPVDGEVTAQYDQLAGLSDELAQRLDQTKLPNRRHDPKEIAEHVAALVAMALGTRPRRVDIDPQGRDVASINTVIAERQRAYFRRLVVEDLLTPAAAE